MAPFLRVARGGGAGRDGSDHDAEGLAKEGGGEQLGERLLLEDGASVLAQREVLDGLAQREEGLVDLARLAQGRAVRQRLSRVLRAREVDEVGARHGTG